MGHWKTMADIRREYGQLSLSLETAKACPIEQFECWFSDVVKTEKSDPTAMVLSTIDEVGHPDSRVVLLKEVEQGAFIFYTNYESAKAAQIRKHPYVALNFYWPEMARQVRIRGRINQTSLAKSDEYFSTRPKSSQLSAIASPQSREIANRSCLEEKLNALIVEYQQQPVVRPIHWGGYAVIPDELEFWQGRDNRLHDRIFYSFKKGVWHRCCLAP